MITQIPTPKSKFQIHLICCGSDDGYSYAENWQEADDFRNSYRSGPGVAEDDNRWHGHVRQGIIEDVDADTIRGGHE